ncbi:hypothetical protein [Maribacter sp. ACAM166]|uniref:hypothetical protein n=1 Tax=Maribacter sp. ACAM166 TaxID=2508996 RepID=UPI0010FCEC6A|nr:hypothetical protein [Maribacter sp. ACAM166]TLP81352.1 hypothetical protein ES765_04920 [Maribacter sp. ACAM166]
MSRKLDEFVRLMKQSQKAIVKPQMVWAKAGAVNLEKNTMVATGVVDDLEYYDVLLGLGHINKVPNNGALCLLGVIGNHSGFTFLIEAESVQAMQIKSNETDLIIDENGYQITKANESLTTILNEFIDEVLKIVVIQGQSVNVPALTAIKQRLNTVLK